MVHGLPYTVIAGCSWLLRLAVLLAVFSSHRQRLPCNSLLCRLGVGAVWSPNLLNACGRVQHKKNAAQEVPFVTQPQTRFGMGCKAHNRKSAPRKPAPRKPAPAMGRPCSTARLAQIRCAGGPHARFATGLCAFISSLALQSPKVSKALKPKNRQAFY